MARTAPSLFWTEPAAFSALLKRALQPAVPRAATPAAQPTRSSETLTADLPLATASDSPFVVPQGPIEERLEALLRWLNQTTDCQQAFVTDPEGLALVHHRASDELVAAAAALSTTLLGLYRNLSLPEAQGLAIYLETEGALHQITTETPWGVVTLGFVTGKPVSSRSLSEIRQALQDSLVEKEQT